MAVCGLGCEGRRKLTNPSDYSDTIKVGFTEEQVKEIAGQPFVITLGVFERFAQLGNSEAGVYDYWSNNMFVPASYAVKVERDPRPLRKTYYYLVGDKVEKHAAMIKFDTSGLVESVNFASSLEIEMREKGCRKVRQNLVNPETIPDYEINANIRSAALDMALRNNGIR